MVYEQVIWRFEASQVDPFDIIMNAIEYFIVQLGTNII